MTRRGGGDPPDGATPDGHRASPEDALERRRRRLVRRIFLTGPPLGVVAAIALGLGGLGGQAGFVAVLLLTAASSMVALLVGAVLAVVDEARDRPASRGRLLALLGLLAIPVVTLVLLGVLSRSLAS